MANHFEIIDETSWPRAAHCAVFRGCVEPAFCVTFQADITNFLQKIKSEKLSFTPAMVYAVSKCANQIEAFRYRFDKGDIVRYEAIDTAFTYLDRDTELFKVVNAPMRATLRDYVENAAKIAAAQKDYFTGPLQNDVFMCSPLPWVDFTHISHTNAGKRDNAVPLFDWGKYSDKNGRVSMPISVQAHHSFVDGIHVGKFCDLLQDYLNHPIVN